MEPKPPNTQGRYKRYLPFSLYQIMVSTIYKMQGIEHASIPLYI
jgi:hypothetical protein